MRRLVWLHKAANNNHQWVHKAVLTVLNCKKGHYKKINLNRLSFNWFICNWKTKRRKHFLECVDNLSLFFGTFLLRNLFYLFYWVGHESRNSWECSYLLHLLLLLQINGFERTLKSRFCDRMWKNPESCTPIKNGANND